ncbi:hypothetical protein CBR_g74660 [Chara braunii]|uniref:Uncharacterized protein n=1 Tax=Chara braunii TaxID=69332 RepID=A0A388KA73_CHABU|nr:hypothetical protein CBR_g74660 [Chara braunii]|eukprot:GBG66974.1 hypothetical protein CBR_g74660 [Chara braunii]
MFRGVYVNIQYLITVEIHRSFLERTRITCVAEFIVEAERELVPVPRPLLAAEPINFIITPDTHNHPLDLTVERSSLPFPSIEVQLMRVESVQFNGQTLREVSAIQTTEVVVGDVCCRMADPTYVILPRLTVCPMIVTHAFFAIEFEVNVVLMFDLMKLIQTVMLHSKRKQPQYSAVIKETLPLRE